MAKVTQNLVMRVQFFDEGGNPIPSMESIVQARMEFEVASERFIAIVDFVVVTLVCLTGAICISHML